MNHYDCLHVTHDASPALIRAAYRVAADQLRAQCDAQIEVDVSLASAWQERMTQLNAAYETLRSPHARQVYDAQLTVGVPSLSSPVAVPPASGVSWDRRTLGLAVGAAALLSCLITSVVWQWRGASVRDEAVWVQSAVQESASALSASQGFEPVMSPPLPPQPVPPEQRLLPQGQRPSVRDMAVMSDEELVRALEKTDPRTTVAASRAKPATAAQAPHPLDGRPLDLRRDGELIDPLAPPPVKP